MSMLSVVEKAGWRMENNLDAGLRLRLGRR